MSTRNQKQFTPVNYREEVHSRLHSLGHYGKEHYYTCPYCQNSEKTKFSIDYSKGKTGLFNCYKCGEKGTGWTLLNYLTGGNFRPKKDDLVNLTDKIIQDSRTKIETETETGKKPKRYYGTLFNEYKNENGKRVTEKVRPTHSFIYRDRQGNELYTRHVGVSSEYDSTKKKHKKIVRPTHKVEGEEYLGKPELIKSVYYGLETVSINSVCFIFEGEKKRDCFETELRLRQEKNETETEISSISSGGSNQKLDSYTIQTLKDRSVKYVVLIPDMDEVGREFVLENKKILDSHKIKSFILDIDLLLPKNIQTFQGYDIEDALKDYYPILESIIEVSQDRKKLLEWNTVFLFNSSEIKFNARYISDYIERNISLEYFTGIGIKTFILQNIQGGGKTEVFHNQIKEGENIIYVSPREPLCRDASERLDLLLYQNVKRGEEDLSNLPISICLNSIHKFTYYLKNASKYVLCIDEIDQTLKELFTSPLIEDEKNKEHRSKVYQILVEFIKNAKKVLFTSSDIPDYVHTFLRLNGIEYISITNEYKDTKKYIQVETEGLNRMELRRTLERGEKASVSINDVKKGKSLKRYLEKHTGKRVLFIEKNKTKEEERILSERDFENYDCVIFTPTIFTGIDINIPFGESHFVFIHNNKTVNHYEILQSCFRFRQSKKVYYYIKEIQGTEEIDPEKIKLDALNRRGKFKDVLEESKRYGSLTSEIDQSMLTMFCEIKAVNNQSMNNLKSEFNRLIHSRVENISTQCIKYEPMESESDEEYKNLEQELKTEEREKIFQSDILDIKRLSELERGSYFENEEEKFSKIKTEYVNFVKIDPEESPEEFRELLETPIEKIKSQVFHTKNLVTPIESLLDRDALKTSSYVGDDNFHSLRTIGVKEVLTVLIPEIDFSSPDSLLSRPLKIDENSLQTLQTKIDSPDYREHIKTLLGIKECEKASYLMRTVLSFLGWKRESEQARIEGKRVRRYTINPVSVQKLFGMGEGVTDHA